MPRPCRAWAVLAGRGGSPGTALLPGRARHGHEVGRAWAVLFSAVPVPAHRVSAIWKSIDVRTTERVSPYVLNNSTGVVRSWARKNWLRALTVDEWQRRVPAVQCSISCLLAAASGRRSPLDTTPQSLVALRLLLLACPMLLFFLLSLQGALCYAYLFHYYYYFII